MPRYARGSLEDMIFHDLKDESAEGKPQSAERRNSRRSRAHRLEVELESNRVTPAQRLTLIRNVLALVQHGFCTEEVAVQVIHTISKGE